MPKVTARRRQGRQQIISKPNILFVVTDDQPTGLIDVAMPYLASQPRGNWVLFPNAIETTPLCGVIRATFFTGQTWQRHGVQSHGNADLADLNEAEALPVVMSAAGYRTGLLGKYQNFWPTYLGVPNYTPAGWDSFWGRGDDSGLYFNWTAHTNIPGAPSSGAGAASDYYTDVMAGLADNFIRTTGDSRPWFLMLTPSSPHDEPEWAPRHAGISFTIPDPADFNTVTAGQPTWLQNRGTLTTAQQANARADKVKAARTLLSMDDAMQTVMTALIDTDQLDNTVVVFCTDNSVMMGRKRLAQDSPGAGIEKRVPYQASVDAQLRIRYPGAVARTEHAPVSTVDLVTSFVQWAGGTWAHPVDGSTRLAEIILDQAGAQRRPSAYSTYDAGTPVPKWEMILRADRIKYVEYPTTGEREVYNLNTDPDEMVNLYGQDTARDNALAAELAQHQANRTFWES